MKLAAGCFQERMKESPPKGEGREGPDDDDDDGRGGGGGSLRSWHCHRPAPPVLVFFFFFRSPLVSVRAMDHAAAERVQALFLQKILKKIEGPQRNAGSSWTCALITS